MAVSEETQAILDRLKAEGQLTRNSGANSIRSVKVQMDRFEGIFNSISVNISEQTNMLRASMGIQEEAIEAQKRANDLAELQNSNPPDPTPPTPPKPTPDPKPESKGIFELMGGFASTLLGIGSKLALGGAGLFVAYNFAKGAIDEATGGGFSRFEDSMIDTFSNVDWTALGESFKTFATKVPEAITAITDFLSDPLGAILAGAGLTAAGILKGFVGGALARGVTRGIVDGVLGNSGGDPRGKNQRGGSGMLRLRNIARTSAVGILAGTLFTYGEDLKGWLETQGVPSNWATVGVSAAQVLAGGLTLGSMFGPPGFIVGAIGTFAYVVGRELHDWITTRMEEARRKARERMDAMDIITGEGLGDDAGLTGTGVEVTTTTPAQRAANAIAEDPNVESILNKVRDGQSLTEEDIATLRKAFGQSDANFVSEQRYAQVMSTLTGSLNNAMANLGEERGDSELERATVMLENLSRLLSIDPNSQQLQTLFNQNLRKAQEQMIEGYGLDESDIFQDLTPSQQENIRKIQQMRLFDGVLPERTSSLNTRDAEIMNMIAEAGGLNGMSQVVIGKLGGDTYMSNNSTRMGDQNVAQVTQISAAGNPMSPLKVVG